MIYKYICKECGKDFVSKKRNTKFCSHKCSVKTRMFNKKTSNSVYNEAVSLLKSLESKGWWVDDIDIFKLIDVWDKIYPGKTLDPAVKDMNLFYEQIITEIILWCKATKKKKEMIVSELVK